MKRFTIYFLILSLLTIVISCKDDKEADVDNNESNELIEISLDQFEHEKMLIGGVEEIDFENELTANGKIVTTVSGKTHVSSKSDGIVEQIYVEPGEFVRKYQTLLSISSNELIVLQQDLAETNILVEKLKYDYERIESLYNQKISSEKEFRAISSEYNSAQVRYNSLKMQLQRLGLNTAKIEEGEFYTQIPVYSPINGVITDIGVVIGEYIDPQRKLFELVDDSKLQIEIDVYEKDMGLITVGNKIYFSSVANPSIKFGASLTSVGISVNEESKTVKCYAKPDSIENLMNNSNVEVFIQTKKHKVLALPSSAFVKSDGKYFVFSIQSESDEKYMLKQTPVEIGATYNGYVEILSDLDDNKILIDGVYNLNVQ